MTPTTPQTEHHIDVISKEKAVAFLEWFMDHKNKWMHRDTDIYRNSETMKRVTGSELYDIYSFETQQ